jgi:hypothetical protein
VIRRNRRIAFDHREALHRNIELFRRRLPERGREPRAYIDFARVNGHRSIGVDGEKTIHLGWIEGLRRIGAALPECKAHDQRATRHLENSTAG